MSLPGQLFGQMPQRLGRPAQRRHRVPTLVRLHQRQQRRHQVPIALGGRLTPPARPPDPPGRQRILTGLELSHTPTHGGRADPRRGRDRTHPAMAQQAGLGRQRQPLLTLVQMRQQHLEPCRKLTSNHIADAHSTSSNAAPE